MYEVVISPVAKQAFEDYMLLLLSDKGIGTAEKFISAYEDKIDTLSQLPYSGCGRIPNIPSKYRVLMFWPHLWFVYQIKEGEIPAVYIEHIINDIQNYGDFLF